MHIHPDAPHQQPPRLRLTTTSESSRANATSTDPCSQHTRTYAEAANYQYGGRSAHKRDGLPNDCALHSPRSRDTNRTYARARTADCTAHLHPPTSVAPASASLCRDELHPQLDRSAAYRRGRASCLLSGSKQAAVARRADPPGRCRLVGRHQLGEGLYRVRLPVGDALLVLLGDEPQVAVATAQARTTRRRGSSRARPTPSGTSRCTSPRQSARARP
jgi:hypothetical protein